MKTVVVAPKKCVKSKVSLIKLGTPIMDRSRTNFCPSIRQNRPPTPFVEESTLEDSGDGFMPILPHPESPKSNLFLPISPDDSAVENLDEFIPSSLPLRIKYGTKVSRLPSDLVEVMTMRNEPRIPSDRFNKGRPETPVNLVLFSPIGSSSRVVTPPLDDIATKLEELNFGDFFRN